MLWNINSDLGCYGGEIETPRLDARYHLRTLLIASAILPPVSAGAWWGWGEYREWQEWRERERQASELRAELESIFLWHGNRLAAGCGRYHLTRKRPNCWMMLKRKLQISQQQIMTRNPTSMTTYDRIDAIFKKRCWVCVNECYRYRHTGRLVHIDRVVLATERRHAAAWRLRAGRIGRRT